MDLMPWLESVGIKLGDGVTLTAPDDKWLGLFALAASYNNASVSTATDQKK
jgi:hypothetical protein